MEQKRDTIGNVKNLIDAADGSIIATKRTHIIASGHHPPRSLASDETSWLYTVDECYCKRRQNVPQVETQWEAASTKGAFKRWTMSQHGYCTFINVVSGAHLVFIEKRKPECSRGISDGLKDVIAYELYGVNSGLWDVDAVVLRAGCQL